MYNIYSGHIPVQCFHSGLLPGEGPRCQDVHQVADPPSENQTSRCTVVFFIFPERFLQICCKNDNFNNC